MLGMPARDGFRYPGSFPVIPLEIEHIAARSGFGGRDA